VDGYGAGTSVVTGLGHPTAGFVYKLVAVDGRPVAKASPGKSTVGGRKWAWRLGGSDVVATAESRRPEAGQALQSVVVDAGERQMGPSLEESRQFHRRRVAELGPSERLNLRWVGD
jgi:nicotinate phosphoribosyltransferase